MSPFEKSSTAVDTQAATAAAASDPQPAAAVGQRHASPPTGRPRLDLRLALITLVLPLYFAVAFSANYIGALSAPKPHHVKVAIVGPAAASDPLARALSLHPRGGFAVSKLTSVTQALRLVGERKIGGAYLPGPGRPTAIVASAASASLANFIEATFRQIAATQGRPLVVDDVRPLPPGDSTGEAILFFMVICALGGYLVTLALGFLAPAAPESRRLTIAVVASVLAPVVAYLIGGPGYGAISGPFGSILATIGVGALTAFAVAVISRLMQLGLGALGALVASLVFLLMNLPSSGGSVAPQLLPGFWRLLNHFWIGAAQIDATRSILYFGGSGVGADVLKILAWLAAWALLLATPIYLQNRRRARAAGSTR